MLEPCQFEGLPVERNFSILGNHDALDLGRVGRLVGFFRRRKVHLEVIGKLGRRDDKDDQQHKRQIQQWRYVQLVEAAMISF